MSCYNWEEGTIRLPKTKYMSIKKEFVAGYNVYLLDQLERSKKLREHVLTVNKGKRNVHWWDVLSCHMDRFSVDWSTVNKMLQSTDGKKPRNLNKKLMGLANSKTTIFDVSGDEAVIKFIDEYKSVEWYVPENNRAVERARDSKIGELFFQVMRTVTWTRGTGGEIVGNDEYTRDSRDSGGGGNYVTTKYGPNVDNRRCAW